ncbi:hypothetical protein LLEC1_07446 [Akanthomyces lecanii]|uniref:Zn(2)-C6 fungal-type domain-containing protein n=1 Tax=Cordyceps confragosa TaxID=2714763 RepID=A0A179ILZ1_CORDF|nr:hypothetical protein LLEC1_07446 [Akanthomyces lecanii]
MDKVQEGMKAPSSNLAWRKRPRQFAPKSRLGCKTCKLHQFALRRRLTADICLGTRDRIRRVKCDLSQPSCLKCRGTGRTCDGYGELRFASGTAIEASYGFNDKGDGPGGHDSHPPFRVSPRSFFILPTAGSSQSDAMSFFQQVSITHLNKYQSLEDPWRKTLMFFSQTVPCVRHAAIALGLLHMSSMRGDSVSKDDVREKQPHTTEEGRLLHSQTPLLNYNRAIQLLLEQNSVNQDSSTRTAITLLTCYLFICFDHLARDDTRAMKHLHGGVQLSRTLSETVLRGKQPGGDASFSEAQTLLDQVASQIRRLDMQAVLFLLDWSPNYTQTTTTYLCPSPDDAFETLDQAADQLQTLVARVMGLRNTAEQMLPTAKTWPPPPPSHSKVVLLGQLKTWARQFEKMLRREQDGRETYKSNIGANPVETLLRAQHKTAWIFLNSYGPGRELEYDAFLPHFQQCVAWADEVAAAHQRYSGPSSPTFTPEIGILPVLYIIGAKCRDPAVRREALRILLRQPIREAVWDGVWTAKVLQRVIEIEEGAIENGTAARSADQIPAWRRIEALSWVHVNDGDSAPRLDLTYTFCAREGVYSESLML